MSAENTQAQVPLPPKAGEKIPQAKVDEEEEEEDEDEDEDDDDEDFDDEEEDDEDEDEDSEDDGVDHKGVLADFYNNEQQDEDDDGDVVEGDEEAGLTPLKRKANEGNDGDAKKPKA
ncbi:hypothetical protein L198_06969 [Cryptococcus wingfieldii CBS 7118]|uniref:Uncharacterized protein n=1 Tax=Cryptococcus wingfieldii CBS 7118 TaxID=1295528 RepID=A0A1E3IGL2_9TREE|nr:hypothetical protein L198_06969 [Cryptococcus wingfieldii CBS 7118]ODN87739.1 hypothetical protein L198_06969 [Cryptococcus wingfieldii CBS 7118]